MRLSACKGQPPGVVLNHDSDGSILVWTRALMFILSVSTFAGAMVIFTLAAIFIPDPPPPLDEDRCGFAFCEVCMAEAPYACSACKTTRYCSSVLLMSSYCSHAERTKLLILAGRGAGTRTGGTTSGNARSTRSSTRSTSALP